MRVAVDARELLGHPTGVGRYLAELVARWTRDPALDAHAVDLFLHAPFGRRNVVAGVGGARATWHVEPGAGGTFWEQTVLARAVARRGADVFFAPAYAAPLLVSCPTVVAMHDVSFFEHPEWFPSREGMRRRVLAGLTAHRAARILTLAESMRPSLIEHLRVDRTRVTVIPPAVDAHPALATSRADVPPCNREPLVLYVGSVFSRRNVPALIRAFAHVAPRHPDATLAIVGANRTAPRDDLAATAGSAGVASRVVLHDYLPDAQLERLYRRARAFVFLSEYEGFGLTPLEAMARGVPAIVLDTAVAREACRAGALYAPTIDAPEVVDWLDALLGDARFHAARQQAGRAAAASWSWDQSARNTWAVFDEVARA